MRPASKILLVVGVVLVLVASGVVGALLGLRRDDSGGSSSSGPALPTPTQSSPSQEPSAGVLSTPPEAGATTPPDPALARFYSQKLSWSGCRGSFQCAKLEVPLDYDHPEGRTIEIALLRDPADDPDHRVGSLVVNPGGPGAPGTDYAASGGFAFGRALRDDFDIVGFDPRGTGDSAPVDCLTDDQLDQYLAADPSPDTPAEVKAYEGWATRFGEGCASRSGAVAGHVTTVETARDMDVLRAALGEKQMDYLGASYGTKLGTTYADLFPSRVGRFVLDGAMDPDVTARELNLQQAAGFETALRSYVKNCVDGGSCFLGDTVDAGVRKVQQILAGFDAHPLTVGGRTLTQGGALYGVITPLYNRSYWSLLDQALQGAMKGDGTMLMTLADAYASRGSSGYTDNSMEANWAINCLDDPWSATPAEVEKDLPEFEKASPTFGDAMAWMMIGCSGETQRATEPSQKAPAVGAKGADPIVVVGTTRDPATPYAWAKSLASELDSSVLVSRDGDGHTGYNSGNSCVDDAVEGYLVDGKVPKDGLSC
ncbi:alpha/beta hydrolase [Nocardioides sp. KR10-350]|uniref:alpha/beta hydrolase n=1 Tax=Nocardioides cheoyonin TaxID=3156615 RepID=UPI0032B3CB87